jgi:hypothetical protein
MSDRPNDAEGGDFEVGYGKPPLRTGKGQCLALIADTSLPGLRVVRELEIIIATRSACNMRLRQRNRVVRHGGPALEPGNPARVALSTPA